MRKFKHTLEILTEARSAESGPNISAGSLRAPSPTGGRSAVRAPLCFLADSPKDKTPWEAITPQLPLPNRTPESAARGGQTHEKLTALPQPGEALPPPQGACLQGWGAGEAAAGRGRTSGRGRGLRPVGTAPSFGAKASLLPAPLLTHQPAAPREPQEGHPSAEKRVWS